jgi:hypothetical protein
VPQPAFENLRLAKLQVPPSRLKSTKGFLFEFQLGRRMVQELRSFAEGSRDLTIETSTPKSMEEVAA